MTAGDTSVKVAVRVRPLQPSEKVNKQKSIIEYPSKDQVLVRGKTFTYDYVFQERATQSDIYQNSVAGLVKDIFQGYNATIFAYGQTGSGKTFTMGTGNSSSLLPNEYGVIPNVITELFETIKATPDTEFIVRITFLEIHNDNIKDLLCETHDNNNLQIREYSDEATGSIGIRVAGLTEIVVTTYSELMQQLEFGSLSRATGSTNMNAHSSRSHAVFSIYISQTKTTKIPSTERKASSEAGEETAGAETTSTAEEHEEALSSKFHFVDLAGSERLKRTGATGERAREGININSGLLALGNVISALGDPTRKAKHVPFRDSKITRLLQDSLGGNSQTLMIACVSPAEINALETLNCLKYANRAKNIKNKPVINRDPNSAKIEKMRARIKQLEKALTMQGGDFESVGCVSSSFGSDSAEFENLQRTNNDLESEVHRLTTALKQSRMEVSTSRDRLLESQKSEQFAILRYQEVAKELDPQHPVLQKYHKDCPEMNVIETHLQKINSLEIQLQDRSADVRKLKFEKTKLEKMVEHDTNVFAQQRHQISNLTTNNETLLFEKEKMKKIRERISGVIQDTRATAKQISDDDHDMKDADDDAGGGEGSEHGSDGDDEDDDDDDDDDKGELAKQLALEKEDKEREHKLNEQHLSKLLGDLDGDLVEKEQLIDELIKTRKQAEARKKTYENKILEMEFEVKQVQEQRDKMLVQSKGQSKPSPDVLNKYETKLKSLRKSLDVTRSKLKDNQALIRARSKDDTRIKTLQSHVDNIKKEKIRLSRKIKEESVKFREWTNETNRKLKTLTKQNRKIDYEMKKMKSKYEAQARVLKRKNQAQALLSRQLRESKRRATGLGKRRYHSNNEKCVKRLRVKLNKEIKTVLKRRSLFVELKQAKSRRAELIEQSKSDKEELESLNWQRGRNLSNGEETKAEESQITELVESVDLLDNEIKFASQEIIKLESTLSELGVHLKSAKYVASKKVLDDGVFLRVKVDRIQDAQSLLLLFMNKTIDLNQKVCDAQTKQQTFELENRNLAAELRANERARQQSERLAHRLQDNVALTITKRQQQAMSSEKNSNTKLMESELLEVRKNLEMMSPHRPLRHRSRLSSSNIVTPSQQSELDLVCQSFSGFFNTHPQSKDASSSSSSSSSRSSPPGGALFSSDRSNNNLFKNLSKSSLSSSSSSSKKRSSLSPPSKNTSKKQSSLRQQHSTSSRTDINNSTHSHQYGDGDEDVTMMYVADENSPKRPKSSPPSSSSSSSSSAEHADIADLTEKGDVYERLSDPVNYTGSVKEVFKGGAPTGRPYEPVLNRMKRPSRLFPTKPKHPQKFDSTTLLQNQNVFVRLTDTDRYTGIQKHLMGKNRQPERTSKRRKMNGSADSLSTLSLKRINEAQKNKMLKPSRVKLPEASISHSIRIPISNDNPTFTLQSPSSTTSNLLPFGRSLAPIIMQSPVALGDSSIAGSESPTAMSDSPIATNESPTVSPFADSDSENINRTNDVTSSSSSSSFSTARSSNPFEEISTKKTSTSSDIFLKPKSKSSLRRPADQFESPKPTTVTNSSVPMDITPTGDIMDSASVSVRTKTNDFSTPRSSSSSSCRVSDTPKEFIGMFGRTFGTKKTT